ncbi:MAG TPA: hypothetical protein VFM65_04740 [Flavobacteriaceae bacterium]|nr:hypothetical protein [Flavobacteriaceae bacterium]
MDIQLEKYKLLEWLIGLKDERIITKIKTIRETSVSSEWTNAISEKEKTLIMKGLKDIEQGNVHTHEEVMREINKVHKL